MFQRKAQTVFQNAVTFLFLSVAIIIIAILSSVTTPLLNTMVDANGITGGMGFLARYWNIILLMVLLFVGIILVFSRGGEQ